MSKPNKMTQPKVDKTKKETKNYVIPFKILNLSFCQACHCMTKTIKGLCGKCGAVKQPKVDKPKTCKQHVKDIDTLNMKPKVDKKLPNQRRGRNNQMSQSKSKITVKNIRKGFRFWWSFEIDTYGGLYEVVCFEKDLSVIFCYKPTGEEATINREGILAKFDERIINNSEFRKL